MKCNVSKCIMMLLMLFPFVATAQIGGFVQRTELVQAEEYEVFSMPTDSITTYYLSVGRPGVGNETVQFHIDPATEMFIPLGRSLSEAIEVLGKLKDLCKEPKGTTIQMEGCLAFGYPKGDMEPVTVTTYRALLTRQLEFTVSRDKHIRSAYIDRSSLSSLLSGLKLYRKMHPKEDAAAQSR